MYEILNISDCVQILALGTGAGLGFGLIAYYVSGLIEVVKRLMS